MYILAESPAPPTPRIVLDRRPVRVTPHVDSLTQVTAVHRLHLTMFFVYPGYVFQLFYPLLYLPLRQITLKWYIVMCLIAMCNMLNAKYFGHFTCKT